MLDNTQWTRNLELQKVACALRTSIDYIEEYGWAQKFGRHGEPVCVVKSLTMQQLELSVMEEARSRIGRVVGTEDLIRWNDSWFRSKGQVLEALREAEAEVLAEVR